MKPLLFIITLWLFFIAAVLCVTSFVQADELVRESRYQVMDDTGQIISQHDEIHVAIREAQAWSKSHDGRVAKIAPPSYRVQVDPITGSTPQPPDTGSGEAGDIPVDQYEMIYNFQPQSNTTYRHCSHRLSPSMFLPL